ncbi:hypothetical protein Q9R19_09445 [Microbacterium sp. ARD32]|uniref:hypothetical protein n=1 Tax=Microbacterium sp. ARD32 TaxID=2962577 RepID=UPI0028828A17|nr:hypothetical protein [Microbacterium sp. ARD32]MDT0157845.1 hypothetical protein [Microbacterium sp. ARD32]
MEWIADPSPGDWLRERLDDEYATMHCVVPRRFPAYARVFHPASVRSLPGRAVPTRAEYERMSQAEHAALYGAFIDEPTTWSRTADAFGTRLHPLAQWQSLVRTPSGEDWRDRHAPDGREFSSPEEGAMPPELLAAVARHLVAHTGTPDAGFAALWEGRGGLLGHVGPTPSRTFFGWRDGEAWSEGADAEPDPRHQEMLQRSIHHPFEDAFRKPTWQPGILSREISEGPRLQLPGRDHVLFSAPTRAFADPGWILHAPWRDVVAEEHGFAPSAQHPSLIWPEDRAWVVVSEIDYDSTIVGGSADLIRAICDDPAIEALPVPENADLTWTADEVNR